MWTARPRHGRKGSSPWRTATGSRRSRGPTCLRDCARRGVRAPVLAVRDEALGFWGGLREVFPRPGGPLLLSQDRERAGCAAEVRAPVREGGASGDLECRGQAARAHCAEVVRGCVPRQVPEGRREGHRRPGPAASVLPLSGRALGATATTNPMESTFATVRHRTKVTKGPGSRAAGLAMAFKLIESAQDRWRAVNAPHLVALVRAGATFVNGNLVERPRRGGSVRSCLKILIHRVLTIAHRQSTFRLASAAWIMQESDRLPALPGQSYLDLEVLPCAFAAWEFGTHRGS
jgi:hypothetical protein